MESSSASVTDTKEQNKKSIPQIVENSKIWLSISGFFVLISCIAIAISFMKYNSPVLLGIDFVGGTKIEYRFAEISDKLDSRFVLEQIVAPIDTDLAKNSIAQVSDGSILIFRAKDLQESQRLQIEESFQSELGEFTVESVDTVSGIIGPELLTSGLLALFITIISITCFVSYRFRRDFALCTIIALVHDVVIVLGLFAILGLVYKLEVNSLFLTACLTVLGFSVHDTIVVFDRVRENLRHLSKKNTLENIINQSISQVWFRSFGTTITLLFVLGTLLLWGGASTKVFAGAMFTGMLSGTYSSLFLAPISLLVVNKLFDKRKKKK